MDYEEVVFHTGQFEATFDLLSHKLLCRLMARLGPHGNARFTSVVPPAPDVADTPGQRLKLTQSSQSDKGHAGSDRGFETTDN